jgi:hypothetical protein
MSQRSEEDLSPQEQKRLQPFLDCVAYLLAKRWLREQQQQKQKPSLEKQEPNDDESEQ